MKADFSRLDIATDVRFDAALHQQGRLWLDSDWNADVFARLARLDRQTIDVIGAVAFPYPKKAFGIFASTGAPDDFIIDGGPDAQGRCYVDGILCTLDAPVTYLSQPDYPNPPHVPMPLPGQTVNAVVYLDVWRRLVTYLQDDTIREIALGGPDTAVRLCTIAQVKVALTDAALDCASAGDAIPATGHGRMSSFVAPPDPPADGCSLADPRGYTGNENRLYRVEIHNGGDVEGAARGAAFSSALASDAKIGDKVVQLATALTPAQAAALIACGFAVLTDNGGGFAHVAVSGVSSDGTAVSLAAGLTDAFTRADGARCSGGAARFKWSRNNAADAVAISVAADRTTVTLASLGRDATSALRAGDLVEVSDDTSDLGPAHGFLTWLATDPDPDALTVTLAQALPKNFVLPPTGANPAPASPPEPPPTPGKHLVLRRWDGEGIAAAAFDPLATPDMDLGDGVRIAFGGYDLQPGDYWLFAARANDATLETLDNAAPNGIKRHRVPIATVAWTNTAGTIAFTQTDCRQSFSPLVDLAGRQPAMSITKLQSTDSSSGSAALANDSVVTPTQLAGGITVTCSEDVEPASITGATCYATLELPGELHVTTTATLDAHVTANGRDIVWRVADAIPDALDRLRRWAQMTLRDKRPARLRFHLTGDRIWAAANSQKYLDGEAFGVKAPDGSIGIALPTNSGSRAADFDVWFSLKPDPQQTANVFITDESIYGAYWAPEAGLNSTFSALKDQTSLPSARGVAVGTDGRVYIANGIGTPEICIYNAGATTGPPATILQGLDASAQLYGIALGPDGTLYVVDRSKPGLWPYKAGATQPGTLISDPSVQLPTTVAVDSTGNIFVSNAWTGSAVSPPAVAVFNSAGTLLGNVTYKDLTNPWGVALDRQANIYVTNTPQGSPPAPCSVLVFSAGSHTASTPIRTIGGPATKFGQRLSGCAVDATGYLYVISDQNVLVFAPEADGNATPVSVLPVPGSFTLSTAAFYVALGPS